jgi:3-phytase
MRLLSLILLALIYWHLSGCSHAPVSNKALAEPPRPYSIQSNNQPLLASTPKKIALGGFSGLYFDGVDPASGNLLFLTHTDRGPNGSQIPLEGGKRGRQFLLPGFTPRLVRISLDVRTKTASILGEILLSGPDGRPLTGIPNGDNDESPLDLQGHRLKNDPNGLDLEGVIRSPDGSLWMGDEYGPSLVHFSADGRWLERASPGRGLPKILLKRQLNRGFEGVASAGTHLFGFLQSPIRGEEASRMIRIVEFDPEAKKTVGQYLYPMSCPSCDKIGDAVHAGNGEFYVLEQDGEVGSESFRRIFKISLKGATRLEPETGYVKTAVPVQKIEVLDLTRAGLNYVEKAEGLALLPDGALAVINDNDFSVFDEGSVDLASLLFLAKPLK